MIKLKTDCDTCLHKDMNYGTGPNDDYSWDDISKSRHVNITFSCTDYRNGQTAIERR